MSRRYMLAIGVTAALVVTANPAAAVDLTTDGGYLFDVQATSTGGLTNGTSDAYDSYCYELKVDGIAYNTSGDAGTVDGGNVTMATVTMAGSLSVTRHAFVPETGGDYIRYFDVIENTGGAASTVDVMYECDLGSDSSTTIWGTYSGDTTLGTDDYWFGTDDADGSSDPSLAHAYFGDGAMLTPSSQSHSSGVTTVTFPVTIGPGETVAFLVFGFQGPNQASVRAQVEALVDDVAAVTEDMDGGDLSLVSNWGLGGAPLIRWAPEQLFEVPEGSELPLLVTIEDREGDTTTTVWDLDNDGDYDDATGESASISAAGLDGPSTLTVGVRSTDSVGNVSDRLREIDVLNAPPVLSSPTTATVLINEVFTYTPEVSDPGGDLVVIEVQDRPVGMVLLPDGGVRWTPTVEDVGDHVLTYRATDDDDDPDVEGDGDAVLPVTITVVANQPPTSPTILEPAPRSDISVARPTLVVTNPTDPEDDALFLWFQVDDTDAYLDPIASGPVEAGEDGTTSWDVPEDLAGGHRYYWRVWATDVYGEMGARAFSYFNVILPDEDGGDVGPDGGDGGPDDDAGPDEPRIEGCGCGAPASPARSAGTVALILIAAALIRLRRP